MYLTNQSGFFINTDLMRAQLHYENALDVMIQVLWDKENVPHDEWVSHIDFWEQEVNQAKRELIKHMN